MDKKDEPKPDDDLEAAEAKSKSVDERVPEHLFPPTKEKRVHVGGAPAVNLPEAGIGQPAGVPDDAPSEGERVLEQERRATRSDKQPG
jgi:hypothetical protein